MTPQRKYRTNLFLFFIALAIGMVIVAAAGRCLANGYTATGVVLALIAAGAMAAAHTMYGVTHVQLVLQMRADKLVTAHAKSMVDATHTQDTQPAPKVPTFGPETYYSPIVIYAPLATAHLVDTIKAVSGMLREHPMILLYDSTIRRYAVLRNTEVDWVNNLDWASLEKDLVAKEIMARVSAWLDTWETALTDQHTAGELEKSIAIQNRAAFLAWLQSYLNGEVSIEERLATGLSAELAAGHPGEAKPPVERKTPLDMLTEDIDSRTLAVEQLIAAILQRKPAFVELHVDDCVELPRGALWTDEAILERFILRLPIPGWMAFNTGELGIVYEAPGIQVNGHGQAFNGTKIADSVVIDMLDGAAFEATKGLSKATLEEKTAAFALEKLPAAL